MKRLLIVGVVGLVMTVGLVFWYREKNEKEYSPNLTMVTPVPTGELKTYTLADIGMHAVATDCWMAIDGGVYNPTSYIEQHPGGQFIVSGCGKDASTLFHNRPNGEGNHSTRAGNILSAFKIGDLAK